MARTAAAPKPKGFKTWVAKAGEVKQKWYVVDAARHNLGRMSTVIAMRLMGKDKPTYTPHLDTGDFVIVVNAEKVQIHPRKRENKIYRRYSGYLGGLSKLRFEEVQAKSPARIVEHAVRLMLPKGRLGRSMLKKLKVFKGPEHRHGAQKPEPWDPLGGK